MERIFCPICEHPIDVYLETPEVINAIRERNILCQNEEFIHAKVGPAHIKIDKEMEQVIIIKKKINLIVQ